MTNGTMVTGGGGFLLEAFDSTFGSALPTVVRFNASGGSVLTGDATAEANSDVDISLATGSTWTGAALPVTNVEVDPTSLWNVTASSVVRDTVTNHGTIAFTPPVNGAFKTLTTHDYTAASTLAIHTFLGTDGSPSDQLVIDTGTATGRTGIRVANAGGPGALTTSDGIKVVDAINGGTTAAGSFTLDGRAVAGAYEYRLFQGGQVDPNDNDWYLRSEQALPGPGPSPEPGPPLYRPEIAAYLGNQRTAMSMFVHTLHERLGEPQFTEDVREPYNSQVGSAWLRAVGRYTDVDPHGSFVFDAEATTWLIQGGGDVANWSLIDEDDRLHVGGMLGYGQSRVNARAVGNPFHAEGDVDGYSVGAYATWYENDADRLGLYLDGWALLGVFDNKVKGDDLPNVDYNSRLVTLSLEPGYAFKPFDDRYVLEPQAQLVYTHYDQDDVTEPNGTHVTGADKDLVTGRLGLRAHATWVGENDDKIQPYLEFNWWHDFQDESVALNNLVFDRGVPNDRFEAGVGFNAEIDKNWVLWANGEYQFAAHGYEGIEGLAGIKYTW